MHMFVLLHVPLCDLMYAECGYVTILYECYIAVGDYFFPEIYVRIMKFCAGL
jgi:hypothetical protein